MTGSDAFFDNFLNFRLTRFKAGNPRIGTPYEIAHACWIEGDPFDALQAIMLFARPEDEPTVVAM